MTTPIFGMQFTRPNDEPVPVSGADFSKILLIEASTDANATMFPVGVPVRFSSSDPLKVAGLGTGPLAAAVRGINDQMASVNAGADITVVRVVEQSTVALTVAGIVTALLAAPTYPAIVGATPRIIWCGRTSYRLDLSTTNPIVAAMPAILEQMLAISIVDVDDTSTTNALNARATMNSQRTMPIGIAVRVYEGASLVTRPAGPRVVGAIARVDNLNKGKPFNPFANVPIYGIAGISRPIPFNLLDGSTEGQQLLAGNISIIAKGQIGVDGAISDGGYVFIGTDNTDTGELWKQIHQVRGSDFITSELMQITREFLGKKITADLVEAWLNSIKFALVDHSANADILGFDVDFKKSLNSPEQIRLGHLTVSLGIETASVFKLADHEIRRYRPAVDGLVNEIIARLNGTA